MGKEKIGNNSNKLMDVRNSHCLRVEVTSGTIHPPSSELNYPPKDITHLDRLAVVLSGAGTVYLPQAPV
jgi:hypothetical protein